MATLELSAAVQQCRLLLPTLLNTEKTDEPPFLARYVWRYYCGGDGACTTYSKTSNKTCHERCTSIAAALP